MNQKSLIELGKAVVQTEQEAISALAERIDKNFAQACQYMLDCEGRVIVTGMGKSGHIGCKIAATLASTGTPSFFVHPGEASHGDLGMITNKDVILAISNSGETDELLTILPIVKRLNVPLITMTGNTQSSLAKLSTIVLDISVAREACPLGLAPTSSTTTTLVLGDALAVALLDTRGFTANDFARSHPAGSLGRRLLIHVEDIMHKGSDVPLVHKDDILKNALVEISRKGLGFAIVVDKDNKVIGVFTDGDLRRALDHELDIHTVAVSEAMTSPCTTVSSNILAAEALQIMQSKKINGIPVVDEHGGVQGVINMHDLLRAGVV